MVVNPNNQKTKRLYLLIGLLLGLILYPLAQSLFELFLPEDAKQTILIDEYGATLYPPDPETLAFSDSLQKVTRLNDFTSLNLLRSALVKEKDTATVHNIDSILLLSIDFYKHAEEKGYDYEIRYPYTNTTYAQLKNKTFCAILHSHQQYPLSYAGLDVLKGTKMEKTLEKDKAALQQNLQDSVQYIEKTCQSTKN